MKIRAKVHVYAASVDRIVFDTHAAEAVRMLQAGSAVKRDGSGDWVTSIRLVPLPASLNVGPMRMPRMIGELSRGVAQHGVSHNKQDRGAKYWVTRQDMARPGHGGAIRRMIFGPTAGVPA